MRNHLASTPLPQGRWGADLLQSWLWSGEWYSIRKLNSKRPLVFDHVVFTKTLGAYKARNIQARINRRLDFLERGIHTNLMGGALAEGGSREGRIASIHKKKHYFWHADSTAPCCREICGSRSVMSLNLR